MGSHIEKRVKPLSVFLGGVSKPNSQFEKNENIKSNFVRVYVTIMV